MRSVYMLSALAICLGVLLAACAGDEQEEPVKFRDLSDSAVLQDLSTMLSRGGISDRSRISFTDHVAYFYDPELEREDPPADYNSRITAYSLLEDNFLETGEGEISGGFLTEDLQALAEDPVGVRSLEGYQRFCEPLPVKQTDCGQALAGLWLHSWENRGIRFYENQRIRLISLVKKEQEGDLFRLTLDGAGLLFPDTEQGLQFLRKTDFGGPYELILAESRQQLADFLLKPYDRENTVLLENDKQFQCP